MIVHKVIVSGITVCKLTIHLAAALSCICLVMDTLDPYTVCPLQIPWTWVYIAGQRDPQFVDSIFLFALTHLFKQIDPCFPQIRHMIHMVVTACHVVVGISRNTVCCRKAVVLCVVCKSIPLPVIYLILSLPVHCHFCKVLYIHSVCNIN